MAHRKHRGLGLFALVLLIGSAAGSTAVGAGTRPATPDTTAAEDSAGDAGSTGVTCPDGPSQGISDTSIKLGTTEPLSGGAAVAGAGFQAGIEAAVAEVNEAGGINGREIEMVILDDGFEAARSVANVRRLADEEQVFTILAPAGSAHLPASYEFLAESGLPMFAPILPPDPDQQEVYLIGTGHADQVRVILDFLAEQGVTRVGMISQDNDLGAAFRAGFDEQAPKHGIELVADEKVEPNSSDVSSAVLNLRNADPEAIISGADNTQTSLVLIQLADLGWDPIVFGNSSTGGPGSPNTVEPAGDAAEGFYSSAILEFTNGDSEAVQGYRAAMEAIGSDQVDNTFALQSYAHSLVFFEILNRMGDELCWDNLHATAESLENFETGLVAPVTFGPLPGGHTGTKGARIAQFTDGEWVFVTDFVEPQE